MDVSSASGRDPVEDFDTILEELKRFSPDVAAKPQIVVANKIDALDDPQRLKALERRVKKQKLPFLKISGATGEGVNALLEAAWKEVRLTASAEAPAVKKADTTGEVRLKPDTTRGSADLIGAERRQSARRKA